MSKKQKNNKEGKQATKIVDQQKEPCLRALQKKVRNITKRLNQIADLQKKNDLKPEQIEKIDRKPQVLEERDKYAEFMTLYQEIITDNQKSYQQWKMAELREVAEVIVAHEYGFNHDNASVENLVKILQKPSQEGLTLDKRLEEITDSLNVVAENTKLKNKVKKFNEENPLKLLEEPKQEKAQEEENGSEANLPLVTKQTISEEQQKVQSKPEPVKEVIHEHHEEHKQESSVKDIASQEKIEQPKESTPPQAEQQVKETKQEKVEEGGEKEQTDNQNDKKKRYPNNNRSRRENGGRKNFNTSRREGENKDGEQRKFRNDRPYHKKKYQQKNPKPAVQDDEDSSSLEKTPEAREFKREQVRELIEDGFIVVGKPKVKGHDQKQYHDHEHGRKNHHHHKKANY